MMIKMIPMMIPMPFFSFSLFPFQPLSLLDRFQDALGTTHVFPSYLIWDLFLHKQPHNQGNNKPESFSIPSCLWPFILIRLLLYCLQGLFYTLHGDRKICH